MSKKLLAPFERGIITKLLDPPPKKIKTISDLLMPFEPGMEGKFLSYEAIEERLIPIPQKS